MGYDVASEDKRVGWKVLILDFMERYFYLICFATYALQEGAGGYERSFSSWMDEHKELRTMYDFAFVTYADLPRGPIKNNSMRRLAATTLLDILPPAIADRVNKKMEEDPNGSHDFLTLVGLVSYYGSGEED